MGTFLQDSGERFLLLAASSDRSKSDIDKPFLMKIGVARFDSLHFLLGLSRHTENEFLISSARKC